MARAEEQRRGSSLCCNLNYLLAIVLLKICCPVIRREREMLQLALVADSSRRAITFRNEWFRTGRLCTYKAQIVELSVKLVLQLFTKITLVGA
jgi:hypothetical protein